MNTNWERDLKQLNSTNGMFTPELKEKITDRLARKERLRRFFQYSSLFGLLTAICLVLTIQSEDLINTLKNINLSNQSSSQTKSIDEVELLTLIEGIPIYPGLKKKSDTLYTYHIRDTSLIALMNYYDSELQKRNWIDYMPTYEDGHSINKTWSNDNLLIVLEFYKDDKNLSTIEFKIFPKEANTQN